MVNKTDEALAEIMKHAVTGHTPPDGFNRFCNDPAHALEIMQKHQVYFILPDFDTLHYGSHAAELHGWTVNAEDVKDHKATWQPNARSESFA